MKGTRRTARGSVLQLVTPRNAEARAKMDALDRIARDGVPPADDAVALEHAAAAAFAEADQVLAQRNFKGAAKRAKAPCTCETAGSRSCESCVSRDAILRGRGEWL